MATRFEGMEEVKRALDEAARIAQRGGALEKSAAFAARRAYYYVRSITHVDTGALKASHVIEQHGLRAYVYPSPAIINPRSRQRVTDYAFYENRRGGSHAFYTRMLEKMPEFAAQAEAILRRSLP